MKKGSSKIENSTYHKFILDCIEKDLSVPQIQRELANRGKKLSIPTLRAFLKKVKRDGINVSQFNREAEKTALAINDKLRQLPELASIFDRRNYLLDTLLERRQKLMDYADEYNRVEELLKQLNDLENLIKAKKYTETLLVLNNIKRFVNVNFNGYRPDVGVENQIRLYMQDMHELFKYVEQWTSKYEINEMLEKVCKNITKAAINSFGNYLKNENEEFRNKIIENFVNNVDNIIKEIKDYELKLGDK